MAQHDVYIYGMTVLSTIHLLDGSYPAANEYREIRKTFVMPGGEAGNAAVVLAAFGIRPKLDGSHLGSETHEAVPAYLTSRGVDCSLLQQVPDFPGWRDLVLCDGQTRTVFGSFIAGLFGGRRLWSVPDEQAIREARCVALDPFFGKESVLAAELCIRHGVDYVTIDCGPDSAMAHGARAVIVSQEFIDREYPKADPEELLQRYRASCRGLVIFTFGARKILCTSPGTVRAEVAPYRVEVVDTLAAGDSFRAGLVYALLSGMEELRCVQFAAATAAVVCTRFPSVHEPPTLREVEDMMGA